MSRNSLFFFVVLFFTVSSYGNLEVIVDDVSKDSVDVGNSEILMVDLEGDRSPAARRKRVQKSKINRSRSIGLPFVKNLPKRKKPVSLREVAPPSSSALYYPSGTDESELENIINEEIGHLFKLLKRKRSADLVLRLGSSYVEKSKLITFKLQLDYEKKVLQFEQKARKTKPFLNLKKAKIYNRKALKLFESFRANYPKHPRSDEVLFFLGFNSYQLGRENAGADYFKELEKRFPKSEYLYESWFQLGEHYFKRQKWKSSFDYYSKVSKNKNGKFYFFALYKMAWSNYKRHYVTKGLSLLKKIVKEGRRVKKTGRSAQSFTFVDEATQDLVLFYTYSKKPPSTAKSYFLNLLDEKKAWKSLEKLAYAYRDTGNAKGVKSLFSDLIGHDPSGPKAFDYKYQIVHSIYDFGSKVEVLKEFEQWVKEYGPGSYWQKAHSKDKSLIKKASNLLEVTIRNYALKNHQTFRISKNEKEKFLGLNLYKLYISEFKKSSHLAQVTFFYGELLFDAHQYVDAVKVYEKIIRKYPNTKYVKSSYINQLLALEKTLPSQVDINKILEGSKEAVDFPKVVSGFIKVSLRYLKNFPDEKNASTILYRVAIFYYQFNQFDFAAKYLIQLSDKYPKSKYVSSVGGLLLDIYNQSKDYKSLTALATRFSKDKNVDKELLKESQFVLEQLSFKQAQDLSVQKKFKESADLYQKFAKENSSGKLAIVAYYNAALNYEKIKDFKSSLSMYSAVQTFRVKNHKKIRQKSTEYLPVLQEKLGFYKQAANGYVLYAKRFPRSPKSPDYWYNAGIIFDALGDVGSAVYSYQQYLALSKNNDRYETLYLIGSLYERSRKWSSAINFYNKYLQSNSSNKLSLVKSSFKVANIYENKLKNKSQAMAWHKKTLSLQKKLGVGVLYGAKSHFYIVKKTYDRFLAIKIPKNVNLQKASVNKKISLLKELERKLKPIIRYNEGEQIIASLSLIGLANREMAKSIYNTPVPKGLDKAGRLQYKEGIKKLISPYIKASLASHKLAIEKSKRFKVHSDWISVSYQGLQSIEMKEDKFVKFINATVLPEVYNFTLFDPKGTVTSDFLSTFKTSLDYSVSKEDLLAIAKAIKTKEEIRVLEAVSSVLNKDPNNVLAINSLAYFYLLNGKRQLGALIINRVLSKGKKSPVLLNNLGVVALKNGDIREGIVYFKKAISVDRSYAMARINLATVFINNYDYPSASSLYKSSYRSFLNNKLRMNILNNYGVSLFGLSKWNSSYSLFKKLSKTPSPSPEILFNYALVLSSKGFKDKSLVDEAKGLVDELTLYVKTASFKKKLNTLSKRIEDRL